MQKLENYENLKKRHMESIGQKQSGVNASKLSRISRGQAQRGSSSESSLYDNIQPIDK